MQLGLNRFRRDSGWERDFEPIDGPVLGLVFGSSDYLGESAPFDDLRRLYPDITLAGCSSAGEILGVEITDASLVVAVVGFASTRFAVVSATIDDPRHSGEVGAKLARSLVDDQLAAVLVFSDGLVVNGSELARGFMSELPRDLPVSGGLAGDGPRFERTWTMVDGQPQEGAVGAVGLYGSDVVVKHGSAGGWQGFGPVRRITRSEGNVLFELDGQPALELYRSYLGDRASGLPATGLLFPLLIGRDSGTPVVRTILAIDEDRQSMTFAGDLAEGADAQLMRASFDALVEGAEDAAEQAIAPAAGEELPEPLLALAVSCVGRRLVLGEGCEEEVEATLGALGTGASQLGFYSYGELSPNGDEGCSLLNQTMTLTTIYERRAEPDRG